MNWRQRTHETKTSKEIIAPSIWSKKRDGFFRKNKIQLLNMLQSISRNKKWQRLVLLFLKRCMNQFGILALSRDVRKNSNLRKLQILRNEIPRIQNDMFCHFALYCIHKRHPKYWVNCTMTIFHTYIISWNYCYMYEKYIFGIKMTARFEEK